MEKYDYEEAVRNDVNEWLNENGELYAHDDGTIDYDDVYDDLFVADSVTGNGSGSYTFNTWKAEEYLCHNIELLVCCIEEFGGDYKRTLNSAENADVSIRCYMLGRVLQECLDKYNEEHASDDDEED